MIHITSDCQSIGSDPGTFMQARAGLYVRAQVDKLTGRVRWFLVFKGNDLHSGTAPTVDEKERDAYIKELSALYQIVGEENRCVFVAYPSNVAFTRTAPTAATAPNMFGNGFDIVAKLQPHVFADDGYPILGTPRDAADRLAREEYFHSYNYRRFCRTLEVSRELTTLKLPDGTRHRMSPLPFDPEHDAVWVSILRGYFQMHQVNCEDYYLGMQKRQFALRQAAAKARWLASQSDDPLADDPASTRRTRGAVRLIESNSEGSTGASSAPSKPTPSPNSSAKRKRSSRSKDVVSDAVSDDDESDDTSVGPRKKKHPGIDKTKDFEVSIIFGDRVEVSFYDFNVYFLY